MNHCQKSISWTRHASFPDAVLWYIHFYVCVIYVCVYTLGDDRHLLNQIGQCELVPYIYLMHQTHQTHQLAQRCVVVYTYIRMRNGCVCVCQCVCVCVCIR